MNGFIIALRVVVPILLLLLIGMLIRKLGWVDEKTLKQMDVIGFKVLLSTQLFYSLYKAEHSISVYASPLLAAVGISVIIFLLSFVGFTIEEKDKRKRGPLIQCMIRYNFVIFGTAVVSSLFGNENTGLIAVISAVVIPLTSTIAAILFEIYRGGEVKGLKLLLNILKNPYLIGAILGLFFMLLNIRLPYVLEKVVSDIGGMATPYCLVVLGGSIHLDKIKEYGKSLWAAAVIKSFIIPLIFVPITIALGFTGINLATIAIMLACPTAVSGFTLANQCGADGELAGQLVVITTIFSIVSMFILIWSLTSLGFM